MRSQCFQLRRHINFRRCTGVVPLGLRDALGTAFLSMQRAVLPQRYSSMFFIQPCRSCAEAAEAQALTASRRAETWVASLFPLRFLQTPCCFSGGGPLRINYPKGEWFLLPMATWEMQTSPLGRCTMHAVTRLAWEHRTCPNHPLIRCWSRPAKHGQTNNQPCRKHFDCICAWFDVPAVNLVHKLRLNQSESFWA